MVVGLPGTAYMVLDPASPNQAGPEVMVLPAQASLSALARHWQRADSGDADHEPDESGLSCIPGPWAAAR